MSAPGYWKYEASGVLRPVVEKYLHGNELSPEEVATMRAYLRQWVFATGWDANPSGTGQLQALRDMIPSLTTTAQIHFWIKCAVDAGMDPL